MSAIDANEAWVLGLTHCRAAPCTRLLHTTDGFARTRYVADPPAGVTAIRFVDSENGVAFDRDADVSPGGIGRIWVTRDAARTWRSVTLAQIPVDVEVTDGSAYVVTCPGLPHRCDADAHLLRAPLGGEPPDPVAGLGGLPPGSRLAAHGSHLRIGERDGLYGSDDGAPFSRRPDPCAHTHLPGAYNPADHLDSLAFDTVGGLVASCVGGVAAGSQIKVVVTSGDGGATWRQTVAPPPWGGDGAGVVAGAPGRYAVISGASVNAVYVSEDGGRNWQTGYAGRASLGFPDVGFLGGTRVYAVEGLAGHPSVEPASRFLLASADSATVRPLRLPD